MSSADSGDSTACGTTDKWCAGEGQLMPTNVVYIVVSVTAFVTTLLVRKDRTLVVMLVMWVLNCFVFWFSTDIASYYVVIMLDFAVYHLVGRVEMFERQAAFLPPALPEGISADSIQAQAKTEAADRDGGGERKETQDTDKTK
eukprot:TRINITY_DN104956_c0_g1_i1.p1 TRINITY_DN104956_c0_g1~~TRINITY_DN104956_c0_g1_i1.p1  ORF type:complete len:143 (-),score=66.25 TRINITY_DN104956_c0_g1_i1:70-498(-)